MANLVITTACNRCCRYCFADKTAPAAEMTPTDAAAVLDLAVASGQPEVRLLGGEPTLHPQFPAILRAAIERGLRALVFSNGLMPALALEALLAAPPDACRVMLNLGIGEARPTEEIALVSHIAAALADRAFAAVNIHSPGLPLSEAAEFAKAHGLQRVIRVGLAHPRLDGQNRWLAPRDYRRVGRELEDFLAAARADGFSLSFDCGFVPCMFSPEFLNMGGMSVGEIGCRCGPIPDVLPDLTAIHCFPLGDLDQLPLSGLGALQELNALLRKRVAPLGSIGVYRECGSCTLRRNGQCTGGCLSVAMLRAHRSVYSAHSLCCSPRASRKQPPRAEYLRHVKSWAIPYIDQPPEFWESLVREHGEAIAEVFFPIDLQDIGSGRPPQPNHHLEAVLRAGVVPMAVLVNPLVLPRPLEEIQDRILDEVARLHEEYGVKAATLADRRLAAKIKRCLPAMQLTASCLLDVATPSQARSLREAFDVLVPATRLLRRPAELAAVRRAFGKTLCLLVNEGCLDSCLDRKQHFYEMARGAAVPRSLCDDCLASRPWLRFTGAWALPQHLALLDAAADRFKLAGRVTLRDPHRYRRVLSAYVCRRGLWPHEIGGGPASIVSRTSFPRSLFLALLHCDHVCDDCSVCRRAGAAIEARNASEETASIDDSPVGITGGPFLACASGFDFPAARRRQEGPAP